MRRLLHYGFIFILALTIALSGCGGGSSSSSFSIAESLVPGAVSFPTKSDDSVICYEVNYSYYIAKYEVTYQLWSQIYSWATNNARGAKQYTFAHPGKRGGGYKISPPGEEVFFSGHETDPVTTINWLDAIVWCNALTEYYNAQNKTSFGCVYKSDNNPIRDATNITACNTVAAYMNAKGFRLPTSMEWELAARYRGNDSTNAILRNGIYYTKGNSASGANLPYTDAEATKSVAWYAANSNTPDSNVYSTQPVGQKPANTLDLYDMTGNVCEWCFDIHSGSDRVRRSGSFLFAAASGLQLGEVYSEGPDYTAYDLGFRPVRTE